MCVEEVKVSRSHAKRRERRRESAREDGHAGSARTLTSVVKPADVCRSHIDTVKLPAAQGGYSSKPDKFQDAQLKYTLPELLGPKHGFRLEQWDGMYVHCLSIFFVCLIT